MTSRYLTIKERHSLLSIPQKVAPLVMSEDDINAVIGTLEKEIFEALDELSEYDPLKIDKESSAVINALEEDDEEDEGE